LEELGLFSDIDLLVVKSGVHRRKLAGQIYKELIGISVAVDIIVVKNEIRSASIHVY
jgi:uncharacterized protein